MNKKINIAFSQNFPLRIFQIILFFEFILMVLDYFFNYKDVTHITNIRRIFNVAREESLLTWASSLQFFFVAFFMWCIYYLKLKSGKNSLLWIFFGIFYMFLSIDDTASVHERLGHLFKADYLKHASDSGSYFAKVILDNFPSYGWQLLFVPIYGIIGLFMFSFIWQELNENGLNKIFLLGLIFYVIAIGMDYLEGIEGFFIKAKTILNIQEYTVSHYSKVIEEFFEMFGTTIILYTLLKYIGNSFDEVKLEFKK